MRPGRAHAHALRWHDGDVSIAERHAQQPLWAPASPDAARSPHGLGYSGPGPEYRDAFGVPVMGGGAVGTLDESAMSPIGPPGGAHTALPTPPGRLLQRRSTRAPQWDVGEHERAHARAVTTAATAATSADRDGGVSDSDGSPRGAADALRPATAAGPRAVTWGSVASVAIPARDPAADPYTSTASIRIPPRGPLVERAMLGDDAGRRVGFGGGGDDSDGGGAGGRESFANRHVGRRESRSDARQFVEAAGLRAGPDPSRLRYTRPVLG